MKPKHSSIIEFDIEGEGRDRFQDVSIIIDLSLSNSLISRKIKLALQSKNFKNLLIPKLSQT